MPTRIQIESIVNKMPFKTINEYLEFIGQRTSKTKTEAQKVLSNILIEYDKSQFLELFHFIKYRDDICDYVSRNEFVDNLEREDLLASIKIFFYEGAIGVGNLELDTDLAPRDVAENLDELLEEYDDSEILQMLIDIDPNDFLDYEISNKVYIRALCKRLGFKYSESIQQHSIPGNLPVVSSNFDHTLLNLTSGTQRDISLQILIDRLRKVWTYIASPDQHKEFSNYNLLFEGGPGLGKTATANYLASVLGLPFYSISFGSISSGFAGETEANINKFFKESSKVPGLVFIDEADSLFHTRTSADHSWQVSIVNEALQHIEKYPGIVIISTNLLGKLDEATIRRFAEKITFLPLNVDQKLKAFKTYFKSELTSREVSKLESIGDLNLGDFLCVRKRTFMDTHSNLELIGFLSDEVKFRSEL